MSSNTKMWSELYRPKSLDDCVLDLLSPSQQKFLRSISKADALPNLLFYGSPGTGKTTIARILCDEEKYCIHYFNGSLINKGKVADELQRFALSTPALFHQQRIMLIDEVDGFTNPAQMALRALIEDKRVPTAWMLTCNIRKNLIDPLLSRLMEFEFKVPDRTKRKGHLDSIVSRCLTILDTEGLSKISELDVRKVVEQNYPDMRRILNALQIEFAYEAAA